MAKPSQPKKRKFNFYDFINGHEGKGVEKHPNAPRNLKFFFSLYRRKFGPLLSLNLLLILGNFPVLAFLFGLSGNLNNSAPAPTNPLYTFLYGVERHQGTTPLLASLMSVFGIQGNVSIPTVGTYIFFGIGILTVFTFGFTHVGVTYVLRSFVREDPVFLWSDFRYAIRRNRLQALGVGIFDSLALFCLGYGAVFYVMNTGRNFFMNTAFYFFLFIALIYWFMRYYLYLLLITFELPFRKILKNALIFAFLGFKRNLAALLGSVILGLLIWLIIQVYLPLGIILPLMLFFSHVMFHGVYAAYPVIQKYMIDPYQKQA